VTPFRGRSGFSSRQCDPLCRTTSQPARPSILTNSDAVNALLPLLASFTPVGLHSHDTMVSRHAQAWAHRVGPPQTQPPSSVCQRPILRLVSPDKHPLGGHSGGAADKHRRLWAVSSASVGSAQGRPKGTLTVLPPEGRDTSWDPCGARTRYDLFVLIPAPALRTKPESLLPPALVSSGPVRRWRRRSPGRRCVVSPLRSHPALGRTALVLGFACPKACCTHRR